MPAFDYLWEGGPEILQSENFRYGTDSILLGHFAPLGGAKNALDLGCASGVISLILLARSEALHVTGLEINADAAAMALHNVEHNRLSGRCEIVNGDIRKARELFRAGSFDLIVSNPPYFSVSSGAASPRADRAEARGEVACTLEDLCAAAGALCRWGGKFAVVYRPERLPELFDAMRKNGIEPKRMRLVCHNASCAPSLVLLEGRRGGKPGLQVERVLFIKDAGGADTEEIRAIYRRN